jgi:hypothetical protein
MTEREKTSCGRLPIFFAKYSFDDRAEHALRRFGGGEVRQLIGVPGLAELDPAGASSEVTAAGIRRLSDDAGTPCPLHNGEVGGEVGIEQIVDAHHLHGGDQTAGGNRARILAERLGDIDTNGGAT